MIKNIGRRLNIYEGIIAISFMCIMVLCIINQEAINYAIPKEIAGYIFFLSLGLCLGFWLYKYEYIRIWKKMKAEEQKNKTGKQTPPISPN